MLVTLELELVYAEVAMVILVVCIAGVGVCREDDVDDPMLAIEAEITMALAVKTVEVPEVDEGLDSANGVVEEVVREVA